MSANRPTRTATGLTEISMNETSVLERMAAGERQAEAECYQLYHKLVWSVVCRFCNDAGEREDAVQEIFVEVWRSAHRYQPNIAKESTFIAMIARRRMIDRLRYAERRPAVDSLEDTFQPDALIAADNAQNHAEIEVVNRLLRALNPDQRKAIHLSVVYGYSHSEIADHTGMPIGTVKTHIRRGLILLRERLQNQGVAA